MKEATHETGLHPDSYRSHPPAYRALRHAAAEAFRNDVETNLQALAADLAQAGLLAIELNKAASIDQPDPQTLVGCTTNGWAKITGTFYKNYTVKAQAGFDAGTGCNNSLGTGSYALVDVEGSVYTNYSYGDDFLTATKSKVCGSEPDYCTDEGAVIAKFSVLLVPENVVLQGQQVQEMIELQKTQRARQYSPGQRSG